MKDFYELLNMYAFDVGKAAEEAKNDAKPLKEIVNEILEEAGLDAVAGIQSEPTPAQHH